MINIENELTILDIDKNEFVAKLKSLGAKRITDERLQKRYSV